MRFLQHLRLPVELGQQAPIGERDANQRDRPQRLCRRAKRRAERGHVGNPAVRWCARQHGVRVPLPRLGQKGFAVGKQVGLVEDVNHALAADFFQNAFHHGHLLLPRRMRGVDHVQQQIRFADLFERGAKRSDEVMRQLADEPDRVAQAEAIPVADIDLARHRIECREQPVFDQHVGTRERLQQTRLARVRVPDQRRVRQVPPALPLVGPVLGHPFEPPPQDRDLATDRAPVGLELGLARSAQSDAAADAGQVGPHPREARQQVFELRELHLHLGLGAAGAGRENVQDDFGAVHDAHPGRLFEIDALHR